MTQIIYYLDGRLLTVAAFDSQCHWIKDKEFFLTYFFLPHQRLSISPEFNNVAMVGVLLLHFYVQELQEIKHCLKYSQK